MCGIQAVTWKRVKKMLKSASKVAVINFLGTMVGLAWFPAGAIFYGPFLRWFNGGTGREAGTSRLLRVSVYRQQEGVEQGQGRETGTSEVELEQSSLMVINVRRSQCNSRRKKSARSSRKRLEDSASTFGTSMCASACMCTRVCALLCVFMKRC